jgi:hypothetical protein
MIKLNNHDSFSPIIYKKRKGIFKFFYSLLKLEPKTELEFKDELFQELVKYLEATRTTVIILVPLNYLKDKIETELFVLICKKSLLKDDKDIRNIFNNIIFYIKLIFGCEIDTVKKDKIDNILFYLYNL